MNDSASQAIDKDILAFEQEKDRLLKDYPNKFVVFKDGAFVGAWDTLDAAATHAVTQFGRGPYLIRQVGAPAPTIPVSILFRPAA
jgi:hypothetical protein